MRLLRLQWEMGKVVRIKVDGAVGAGGGWRTCGVTGRRLGEGTTSLVLEFSHSCIRNRKSVRLGLGFFSCYTIAVVETITHLSISTLQTRKTECKNATLTELRDPSWWSSSARVVSQSQEGVAQLSQIPLKLQVIVRVQMSPLAMCLDPCKTRSCQSVCPASSKSKLADQALGQHLVIPSIAPPTKYAKSISELKGLRPGKALESQFISSLFLPGVN